MEASPPPSNAGPRKKAQTKVASEQALAWSGLPVVTIRPTVLLEGFFLPPTGPSVRNRGRIELPFGRGKTSPVATPDVARVVVAVLADPGPHLGPIYELTGPQSQNIHGVGRRVRRHGGAPQLRQVRQPQNGGDIFGKKQKTFAPVKLGKWRGSWMETCERQPSRLLVLRNIGCSILRQSGAAALAAGRVAGAQVRRFPVPTQGCAPWALPAFLARQVIAGLRLMEASQGAQPCAPSATLPCAPWAAATTAPAVVIATGGLRRPTSAIGPRAKGRTARRGNAREWNSPEGPPGIGEAAFPSRAAQSAPI
jgi:hypothetical protein